MVITCEHGGNRIPAEYRDLFRAHTTLLDTHLGYDPGALKVAQALARTFDAPLVSSTVSRLLIDLNRSIGHPNLHFETSRALSLANRRALAQRHYAPYRTKVEQLLSSAIQNGARAVHLSSHSFTPALRGEVRNADIGLLYDPRRSGEVELAKRWQRALHDVAPALVVRRNYPYEGKNDGLTSHLRKRFSENAYVGIEIEVNQKHVFSGIGSLRRITRALIESLQAIVISR